MSVAWWVQSYREGFAGGGIMANVGNFVLIFYHGEYRYEDAQTFIHFGFWQPALASTLSSVLFGRLVHRMYACSDAIAGKK